jgi:hypothetical protein
MNSPLSAFVELPFPDKCDIVYVLCFVSPGQVDRVPFYVGETSRHMGRIGDYITANFSAQTDFKVGEAVKCLRQLGCLVVIRYKESTNRKRDQDSLIASLRRQGFRLLNDLEGYNYITASEEDERRRIQGFVKTLVS